MSDGLTAEQEAERRYEDQSGWESDGLIAAFVAGAEWATEREKARAEAAEARVAELKAALQTAIKAADSYIPPTFRLLRIPPAIRALAAPTTEAATE